MVDCARLSRAEKLEDVVVCFSSWLLLLLLMLLLMLLLLVVVVVVVVGSAFSTELMSESLEEEWAMVIYCSSHGRMNIQEQEHEYEYEYRLKTRL